MADQLSRVFAALSDPIRRDLLARLAVADATVGQLAAPYDVTVQAVSKHLKVLQDAGLVESREAGTQNIYAVRLQGFRDVREFVDSFWSVALSKLEEMARR